MGTIEGILVYGLVFIMLVVGFVKLFFDGLLSFLWTALQYGIKIAGVILIIYIIFSVISHKK